MVQFLSQRLFRRHIRDRAKGRAGTGEVQVGAFRGRLQSRELRRLDRVRLHLGQAEVQHFRMASLGNKDVGGLDIAVHDSGGMRGIERIRDFSSQPQNLVNLHRTPANPMFQGHPFEELHRDEGMAVLFADVVDGADVGMIESGGGLGLTPKSRQGLRVADYVIGKEFQRDEPVQARVLGFVDDPHAAAP